MTITTCPDCGSSPADSRCECDFMGLRAARRMAELEQDRDEWRDRAELRGRILARCDEIEEECKHLRARCHNQREEIVRLERDNSELRKDRERLDWALTDGIEVGWEDGGPIFAFDRDAIDAAMSRLTK